MVAGGCRLERVTGLNRTLWCVCPTEEVAAVLREPEYQDLSVGSVMIEDVGHGQNKAGDFGRACRSLSPTAAGNGSLRARRDRRLLPMPSSHGPGGKQVYYGSGVRPPRRTGQRR